MADSEDGALLISTAGEVRRLADGKVQMAYPLPVSLREFRTPRMLRDRDGGLWVGTFGGGVVHVHAGRTDVFSQPDGLTGDAIYDLFEDREGNVWVATGNGLDRFRELPVVTYSTSQGFSNVPSGSVLPARNGSIWFSTRDGLNRLTNGRVTAYRQHGARVKAGVAEVTVNGLPDHALASLFEDSRGRIWVSALTGIAYLKMTDLSRLRLPGETYTPVHGMAAKSKDTATQNGNRRPGQNNRNSATCMYWKLPWVACADPERTFARSAAGPITRPAAHMFGV
jgi:ligand-binding sensor domain-containing protein